MAPEPIDSSPHPCPPGTAGFPAALPSDSMRNILRYWAAAREGSAMPRRPRFDPLRFPDLLPVMQLHERKSDRRYLCRVSGTEIVAALGYESTGRYLDEVVLLKHLANRVAIFDRVLAEGLPLLYDGHLVVRDRAWKRFQRLLLPLADAQGEPRFLLSLLHFERLQPVAPPVDDDRHGVISLRTATAGELSGLA